MKIQVSIVFPGHWNCSQLGHIPVQFVTTQIQIERCKQFWGNYCPILPKLFMLRPVERIATNVIYSFIIVKQLLIF